MDIDPDTGEVIPVLFDLETLDIDTRDIVQREDQDFDRNMGEAGRNFILACHNLSAIHIALKYKRPGFVNYCASKPGLSDRTAGRMLRVSEMLGTVPNIVASQTSLYLLADNSTPEAARENIIARMDAGEEITTGQIKAVVTLYRNAAYEINKERDATGGMVTLKDGKQVKATADTVGKAVDIAFVERAKRQLQHIYDNGRHKPKTNRAGDEYVPQGYDACQTPASAIDPLLPYLNNQWTIWEAASGEGLLVEGFYDSGFKKVEISDILTGQNFFEYQPEVWDCLITNPPYSIKYQWLERCYTLGKPFALLLPVETLGAKTAQVFFRSKGLEIIFMDRRVNFKMPNIGFDGSAAQFPVAWFTWGLDIGQEMTFSEVGHDE